MVLHDRETLETYGEKPQRGYVGPIVLIGNFTPSIHLFSNTLWEEHGVHHKPTCGLQLPSGILVVIVPDGQIWMVTPASFPQTTQPKHLSVCTRGSCIIPSVHQSVSLCINQPTTAFVRFFRHLSLLCGG